MFCENEMDIIYKSINDIKYNIFCFNTGCKIKEYDIVNQLLCELLKQDYNYHPCKECCSCECISLIALLIRYIECIEDCTNCVKNYGYLAQIDRLKCILINLERLLCQLKCLNAKDCNILAKVLCVLYEVLETISNIVSKLNNIECLCEFTSCCKANILECMLCNLVNDISNLEENVSELAHLVIQLTSLNVINCTSCTVSRYTNPKNKDYIKDYCEKKSLKYFE